VTGRGTVASSSAGTPTSSAFTQPASGQAQAGVVSSSISRNCSTSQVPACSPAVTTTVQIPTSAATRTAAICAPDNPPGAGTGPPGGPADPSPAEAAN